MAQLRTKIAKLDIEEWVVPKISISQNILIGVVFCVWICGDRGVLLDVLCGVSRVDAAVG